MRPAPEILLIALFQQFKLIFDFFSLNININCKNPTCWTALDALDYCFVRKIAYYF